jgi:transcriptional regulator with XRE-family HTH domain
MVNLIMEESEMLKPQIRFLIAKREMETGNKIEYQEYARLLGVTKNYFSQIMNGHVTLNNMEKAYKLAKLLECEVGDLYKEE